MSDVQDERFDKYMAQGQKLGHTGQDLEKYIEKRLERDERALEREKEKERQVQKELQIEESRRLAEEKKMEFELKKHELDIKALELKQSEDSSDFSTHASNRGGHHGSSRPFNFPKLPTFKESIDSIDAFLYRFETHAEALNWPREKWPVFLSAVLEGTALSLYHGLCASGKVEYEILKQCLLTKFQCSAEGFREKFRSCRPEAEESFKSYGAGGWLEVIHPDGTITQVASDDTYNYNRPPVHTHDNPVVVNPGDYLRLTCLFSSKDGTQERNRTIYFGEGSDGEMCYAFIAYYPNIDGFEQCLEFDTMDLSCPSASQTEFQHCLGQFVRDMSSSYIPDTLSACGNKTDELLCDEECKQALDVLYSHTCMTGRLGNYVAGQVLRGLSEWSRIDTIRKAYIKQCGVFSVM